MPLTDVLKKRIAQQHKIYFTICRNCGVRNPLNAVKCRKCRSKNLRRKKRGLGTK